MCSNGSYDEFMCHLKFVGIVQRPLMKLKCVEIFLFAMMHLQFTFMRNYYASNYIDLIRFGFLRNDLSAFKFVSILFIENYIILMEENRY